MASQPGVQTLLQEWDIAETESLLQKLDGEKSKRAAEDQHRREAEKNKLVPFYLSLNCTQDYS